MRVCEILTRRMPRRSAVLAVALFVALAGVPAHAATSLVAHQTAHQVGAGITTQSVPGDITTQVAPDGWKNQNVDATAEDVPDGWKNQ